MGNLGNIEVLYIVPIMNFSLTQTNLKENPIRQYCLSESAGLKLIHMRASSC